MKKQKVLFFFLITTFLSKAKVNEILLNDDQIQSVSILVDSIKSNDSIAYRLLWKNDKALSVIPFNDFMTIIHLSKPLNKPIYGDSILLYKTCSSIAEELKNKCINDIKSESAEEKLTVANLLKFEKGQYFESNLKSYLQNQIFDFYYNNKVISYLHNDEYVKLLKDNAVYKVLMDTKIEESLENEIIFLAKNSKTYLF